MFCCGESGWLAGNAIVLLALGEVFGRTVNVEVMSEKLEQVIITFLIICNKYFEN